MVEVEVVEQWAQVIEHVTEMVLVVRVDVVVKVAEQKVAEQPGFGILRGVDDELYLLGDGERRSGGVNTQVVEVTQIRSQRQSRR